MPDPSRVFDLHHSSWQRQILNPLREEELQPHGSWLDLFSLRHNGNSKTKFCIFFFFNFFVLFRAASVACGSCEARGLAVSALTLQLVAMLDP